MLLVAQDQSANRTLYSHNFFHYSPTQSFIYLNSFTNNSMKKERIEMGRSFSKKGQITVFIIIGIVLLFTFAVILYITKETVTTDIEVDREKSLASIPQTFHPLVTYTEECLNQVGTRSLILLGAQGGYLYPDLIGEFSARNPTDAQGINLEPLKVPYWYYNQNPNSNPIVAISSLQPKLTTNDDPTLSIEAQLTRTIEEKMASCLQDYAPFESQGFLVTQDQKMEAKVTILDGTVILSLTHPLSVQKGEEQDEIEKFTTRINLDIKRYYELASGITESQKNYTFLEKQTLDLIQVFSAVNSSKLPPTSATTFELVPTVSWSEVGIKENLKTMLTSYVPALQLVSSANFYRYEYPVADLSGLYQRTYDNMILPIPGAEELVVRFDYLNWEPYLRVNEQAGQVEPTSIAVHYSLLHFGTQQYNTVYDVSHPVLVTIHDPNALAGQGYTFTFAMESNVRGNQPARDQATSPEARAVDKDSLVCNENQRKTEIVRTLIVDSYTKEPVEGVQIALTIPEQDTCVMGVTDDRGLVEQKYPAIYGGTLSLIKQDYLTDFYPIDTYKKKDKPSIFGYAVEGLNTPVIQLHEIKSVPVTIKKKLIEKCVFNDNKVSVSSGSVAASVAAGGLGSVAGRAVAADGITINEDGCYFSPLFSSSADQGIDSYRPELLDATHTWTFTGSIAPLESNEKAVLTLKRVGGLEPRVRSQEFVALASIENGKATTDVDLVPGIYEVTGFVITSNEIVIPKEERCSDGVMESIMCFDTDGCCFNLDETRLQQFIIGQVEWNDEKTYLTITPEQLYSAQGIEFYIPVMNLPRVPEKEHKRVVEDLSAISKLSNHSRTLRSELEPQYK